MEKRIIEIMKDVLETENITADSTQETVDGWSSLRQLTLASELEDAFDIELDPAEIARMKSVRQIVAVVSGKV